MKQKFATLYNCDGSRFVKGQGGFGTLMKGSRILDGEFKRGRLNGSGSERTLNPATNFLVNDYIGSFRYGEKHGEGRCYYDDGSYEGDFERGKRSGRGVMHYKSGGLYIGEWKNDAYHGSGVLVQANGNRFEGSFESGLKHGEGIFFHRKSGQVQCGVWINDVCKCSMLQDDESRARAEAPSPFPIPELQLANPELIVARAFETLLDTIDMPTRLDGPTQNHE